MRSGPFNALFVSDEDLFGLGSSGRVVGRAFADALLELFLGLTERLCQFGDLGSAEDQHNYAEHNPHFGAIEHDVSLSNDSEKPRSPGACVTPSQPDDR
jgi:hypothetical protein